MSGICPRYRSRRYRRSGASCRGGIDFRDTDEVPASGSSPAARESNSLLRSDERPRPIQFRAVPAARASWHILPAHNHIAGNPSFFPSLSQKGFPAPMRAKPWNHKSCFCNSLVVIPVRIVR